MNVNGTIHAVNPGVQYVRFAITPELRVQLDNYHYDEPIQYDWKDIPVNATTCGLTPEDAPQLAI